MVASSETEILSAFLFENESLFESICNPTVSESESNENESEKVAEKPNLQFRDQFGRLIY